jgi:hypothetical protein
VIAYQMLSGRLPYGAEAARVRTRAAQRRLQSVHPDPLERYESLSEFVHDLRHPNSALLRPTPLVERNPALFWKGVSVALGLALFLLLLAQLGVKT